MVDISSQNNKINITVSSSGNTANTNVTPDYAQYYSEKSKEWAISNRIVDNTDYSSKYYANESKKQADISTAKATEVVESGNTAVSNIESARDNAIIDITNQESLSVDNVNTAGATQIALATEQANIATEQATIATNKTSEVVASGNEALTNIDTAKNNAITSITNQETTSKNNVIAKGTEQIELIQNEGATQVSNVQSTGFYMRDDKLYYINSQGEETEFKSGGSGLEVCDIGMALYVDESKGLRRYLNGQIVDINTNTQAFLNRLLQIQTTNPDYFTTEENWQAEKTINLDGCVYKFVLNYDSTGTNVVSVRLPKYPDYIEIDNNSINNTAPVAVYGNGMTLGFSQTKGGGGSVFGACSGPSGYMYVGASTAMAGKPIGTASSPTGEFATRKSVGLTSDSSKSGIKGTATITSNFRQTKLKMRYFIQIATGSETENNIVNDIELNNPYSLFDSKYSDHELNNLSWLKSEGQWNAKTIYTDAYDKLLKVQNGTETVEGLSVKLSTETYTDYDFVLKTANETFRLPLKNHTADDSIEGLTLYFYVGETVQNANLIDAGRIGEQLATKTDMLQASGAGMPSNKYIDLTLGASGSTYTAPANGWFYVSKASGANNQYLTMGGNGVYTRANVATSGQNAVEYVPCKKGAIISVNYNLSGTTRSFRFIYAEGEV